MMKLTSHIIVAGLVAASALALTACHDDDFTEDVYPDVPGQTDRPQIEGQAVRVKIGAENRVALPATGGKEPLSAYSLNPAVARVVDGTMIEGMANGQTEIVITDASAQVVNIPVSVYTTDKMELSCTALSLTAPLGFTSTAEANVVLGNGDYTATTSDPDHVTAEVTPEGVITVSGAGRVDPYTATVTIKDCTGLTADIAVTVTATMDPFTDADIQMLSTTNDWLAVINCKGQQYDGPYYFYDSFFDGYQMCGPMTDPMTGTEANVVGWWLNYYGSNYGGLVFTYPDAELPAVGVDTASTCWFQYSYYAWYPCDQYQGTMRVLRNDAGGRAVIWWNVDLQNECINRAYVVTH